MKRNSPIVVTGANGLAGSAIVRHLRKQMYTCVIPLTHDDVDLLDFHETCKTFARIRPQYVVHMAARVYGLGGNMANQGRAIFQNTVINTNVIEASRRSLMVKKFVAMGTNAIYPDPPVLPYNVDNIFAGRPHSGEAGYGHAKRHMLAMLEAYQQSYGFEYTYLVSGNLYGPGDTFDEVSGHVIPSLIRKFWVARETGCPVNVWGGGGATRDFLYVDDLARIVQVFLTEDQFPGPINIGSGERTSISEVVDALCAASGISATRIQWDTSKPTGRLDCFADLTKLQALGFKPMYGIQAGLTETWDWYCADRKRVGE